MTGTAADALDAADRDLLEAARRAGERAFAPYSGFLVGAAARTSDGVIHPGANLENASYGLSLCAEVQALMAASFSGGSVVAIAVTGRGRDAAPPWPVVTPCGRCRQLIAEAAARGAHDVRVIAAAHDFSSVLVRPISALLPDGFGRKTLGPR